MRILITILVLIFSLQSWTKADVIKEFEMEGMTVGNSLLNYFNRDKIEQEKNSEFVYKYKDNKFFLLGIGSHDSYPLNIKLENYDELGVVIKPNDKNYIIYSLSGEIFCTKDINICLSKQKIIISELKDIFGSEVEFKTYEEPHRVDQSGNSIVFGNEFNFPSGSAISINVYQWSNKLKTEENYSDILKVSINSDEYSYFLRYEAYE